MSLIKSYVVPFSIVALWAVLTVGALSELARRRAREPAPPQVQLEETIVVVGNGTRS